MVIVAVKCPVCGETNVSKNRKTLKGTQKYICNNKIEYISTVSMGDNYLPVFGMNEQMSISKNVDEQIDIIRSEITAKAHKILEATEEQRALHARVELKQQH